ncbi:MAG TPA: efflux RND transporter periplasmic adaptor subunit [Bacteroidota bacterium]
MNFPRWTAGTAAGCLLLISLSGPGCGPAKNAPPAGGKTGDTLAQAVPVGVARVERVNLTVVKVFSGTLEGEEQANVVSRISERVTGLKVHVGEPVRAGQLTILLDRGGASSQYLQMRANFTNQEKSLERMKSLYKEGAVALQALDGTQAAYDIARANFEAARSNVELTTPIDGVVTAVNVSLGDLTTMGQVVVTVARINNMKVTFDINETDVANVTLGQKVSVFSEASQGSKVEGKIIQLSKSADIRSRSFEVKAMFPNTADRWYKPGVYVKVNVAVSPHDREVVVPNLAIQSDDTGSRVYLIRNGRSYRRQVRLGVTDGVVTAALEGLAEGDTVAIVGVNNIRDNGYVKIVTQ